MIFRKVTKFVNVNCTTTTIGSGSFSGGRRYLYINNNSSNSSGSSSSIVNKFYSTISNSNNSTDHISGDSSSNSNIPKDREINDASGGHVSAPSFNIPKDVEEFDNNKSNTSTKESGKATATTTTTTTLPGCWCLIGCKLKGKRIHVSKIKPIKYDTKRGDIGSDEYIGNCDIETSQSRKDMITELCKAKDQYVIEQKKELDEEEKLQQEKLQEQQEIKKIFSEDDDSSKSYPNLLEDDTSIGPIHVLYKNQWVITIVERMETDHKDNEPSFILKFKTPIRQKNDMTFSIESLDTMFSSIDKLLSFTKSVEIDKEFDQMYLTKSSSVPTKQETKTLLEQRPYMKEALIKLKASLLPSIGFEKCSIDVEYKKENPLGCKGGNTDLEFPDGVYQFCLEVDSNEHSIWLKSPEAVEKILYLYTIMLDTIVSMGNTLDTPIDTTYL
ncbi:hypothetical protein CYY_009633 [Polysphondylium violaceum]|uniref:Uncharacterized protein n=1 Tax=Polysphondylium violaceum TaxID=133409 RepID=A0A8J4UPD0_9MYCE|nr:hypothetical protein CYY_009633 [Polysphondylium violaceum]